MTEFKNMLCPECQGQGWVNLEQGAYHCCAACGGTGYKNIQQARRELARALREYRKLNPREQ